MGMLIKLVLFYVFFYYAWRFIKALIGSKFIDLGKQYGINEQKTQNSSKMTSRPSDIVADYKVVKEGE
ncbi:MAG: hypothetical protein H6622_13650 [Halobacteriovoraceae bacterium]|nr:hypothetical protein [Halobacteriovoraceae bacterium]